MKSPLPRETQAGSRNTTLKFTIGRDKTHDEPQTGKVKEVRMKLEENLRKEKREYMVDKRRKSLLELVRSSLLTIPGKKR